MPRTRQLKHDFFLNEELAAIEPMARLLFAGLWVLADREGRLEDRPAKIKAQLFPYHEADIDALLVILSHGFIKRYAVEGVKFIQVHNFKKHQHIHPDEKSSIIPQPKKESMEISGDHKTHSEIMPYSSSFSNSPSISPEQKSPAAPHPSLQIFRIWDGVACAELPKIREITKVRLKSARERWKEHPESAYWSEVITRINASSFCCGRNDRKWLANIDFLLRPESSIKVLEGMYDDPDRRGKKVLVSAPPCGKKCGIVGSFAEVPSMKNAKLMICKLCRHYEEVEAESIQPAESEFK